MSNLIRASRSPLQIWQWLKDKVFFSGEASLSKIIPRIGMLLILLTLSTISLLVSKIDFHTVRSLMVSAISLKVGKIDFHIRMQLFLWVFVKMFLLLLT